MITEAQMKENIFSEHQTITSKVTDYLKYQLMISSRFKEGDFLREAELAQSLNISRAPVREALKQLESIGLVKTIPRKGVQIREFTRHEIEELYELRITLENSVFEKIVEQGLFTPAVKVRFTKMLDELMAICESEMDRDTRIVEFSKKDLEFHQCIAELSDRPWTVKILSNIYSQMQFVLIRRLREMEKLSETVKLHYHILDWLEEGDLDKLQDERRNSYFMRSVQS